MRFSIRWLLAVTAYIALLAASIGSHSPILVDLVWGVTLFACCYAIVVACIDYGKRQAMAVGFVSLSAIHIVCIFTAPRNLPAVRILHFAGYYVGGGEDETLYVPNPNAGTSAGRFFVRSGNFRAPTSMIRASGFVPDIRTSNAVVTLAAGLVGCLIGLLAYNHRSKA